MFPCNSLDRGNIPTPNLPSLYSSVMFNPCTSDHTNLWFYSLLFSHFQKPLHNLYFESYKFKKYVIASLYFIFNFIYCILNPITLCYLHFIVISLITQFNHFFNQSSFHQILFYITFCFTNYIFHSFKLHIFHS